MRAILPDADEESILKAVPLAEAESSLQWLRDEYGIEVAAGGGVARDREPRLCLLDDFKPVKGLMGTLTREVQRREREKVIARHTAAEVEARKSATLVWRRYPGFAKHMAARAAAHQRHVVRLRSSSGVGVHEWAVACPKAEELSFRDMEFNYACRWRLGLPLMQVGHCQLCSKDSEDWYGKPRDALGDHALLCGKGCGRYRVHNALCSCIVRFARQSGVEVERAEVCPELVQGEPGTDDCREARLDVHLWSAVGVLYEEWLDITVTHPWRQTSRREAAENDGVAVKQAEGRKPSRYGRGSGGVFVAPSGFESWGRLGDSCQTVLQRLAAQRCVKKGHENPCRVLRRWFAELGAAQLRAMALTAAQASRPARCAEKAADSGDGD